MKTISHSLLAASLLLFFLLLSCGGNSADLPDLYCGGERLDPLTERCSDGTIISAYSSSSLYSYPYPSSPSYSSSSLYSPIPIYPSSSSYSSSSLYSPIPIYSSSSSYSSSSPYPPILIYSNSSGLYITYNNQTYKVVQIVDQIWMAENLNYPISNSECYNREPSNCTKYGRLYSWQAAMEACPEGWHLPSKEEWDVLVDACGGYLMAGKEMKAKNSWNNESEGNDIYGFSALPGGDGGSDDGFHGVGDYGNWWSSTEYEGYESFALNWSLHHNANNIYQYENHKSNLYSVRCLKN